MSVSWRCINALWTTLLSNTNISRNAFHSHCPVRNRVPIRRVRSVSSHFIATLATLLIPVRVPVPLGWTQYRHPNGDVYFCNADLQVITPDEIRDPEMLEQIANARDENVACLEEHPIGRTLPDDLVQVITEPTEEDVSIRMYSDSARAAYSWDGSGTRK